MRVKLWWKKIALTWRFILAHHPLCEPYSDQVFVIFGVYLCQGCTLIYSGLFIGFITFVFINTSALSLVGWLIVATLLVLPTFLAQFFSLSRPFKRITRFINGVGFSSIFWGTISLSLVEERIMLIIYMVVIFLLFKVFHLRSAEERDLCRTCAEFKKPIICSGYKIQAQAEDDYSNYVIELLEL